MPDTFVPMREWLRPPEPPPEAAPDPEPPPHEPLTIEASETEEAIAEARRFRAAFADVTETCVRDLLTDICAEVVGRELQLGSCDIARIIERAIANAGSEPVRIRVHPSEAPLLAGRWNVVCDETLRAGDAILETSSGTIDARLGVRLARVLENVEP